MTTAPKTPTPQGISALLRKAGFERSETSTTRIPGWHNHSHGYTVHKRHDGTVAVHHELGYRPLTPSDFSGRVQQQERYARAIEAGGYAVERGDGGPFGPLIVRAKAEES